MKQYIFVCLLLFLYSSFVLRAQVGINTQDPKGIFHLHLTEDVLVDGTGNIGTGTLSPTARLHLKSSVVGSAFRLSDGSEGENKILLGDKDGYAWWGVTKGLGGYLIPLVKTTLSYTYNAPKIFPVDSYNNQITVSNNGSYAVMVRYNVMLMKTGMSTTDNVTPRSRLVDIRYELKRKRVGVATDVVLQTVNTKPFMQIFDFSTLYLSLIAADVQKGDMLYLQVTFRGSADSDGSALYLSLDYNNGYKPSGKEAFDTGAIIFYQL